MMNICLFFVEGSSSFLEKSKYVHKISNHPVHIIDENGEMSPSSFIPFCQIGDRVLGVKRDEFPIPVCNIFRPKIINDQLCYEIDSEVVEDAMIKKGNLEIALFIDINEDRQFSWISKDVLKRTQGKLYLFSHKSDSTITNVR